MKRRALIVILCTVVTGLSLIKAPPDKSLAKIESPWAIRELYYINGSLWWRHLLKKCLIMHGTLELWYPVYVNVSDTIAVYITYNCNEYSRNVVWIGYIGHTYKNRTLDLGVLRFGAIVIPSTPGVHKTTFKVKANETGIFVLNVMVGSTLTSSFHIFSTIIGESPDLGFSYRNYANVISEFKKIEKLLNDKKELSIKLYELNASKEILLGEIAELEKKICALNSTLIELKANLSKLKQIYLNKSSEINRLETKVNDIAKENKALLSEIAESRNSAFILFAFTAVLAASTVVYRKRKLGYILSIMLLLIPMIYSQPSAQTVTDVIYSKGLKIEVIYPAEPEFPLKIIVKYPYPLDTLLKGAVFMYRVDKTGLYLVGKRSCLEFESVDSNFLSKTDTVYTIFDKSTIFDYKIPEKYDCSYFVDIFHNKGNQVMYRRTERKVFYGIYAISYLLYSLEGDFFHRFKSIFSRSLVNVKEYENEVTILRNLTISLNASIQELLNYKLQLSNLAKTLEEEIINTKSEISEYKTLICELNVRENKLSEQFNSLIEENLRLKSEKEFWITVYQVSIIVLVFSIIVSVLIVCKTKYMAAFLVFLIISSALFAAVNIRAKEAIIAEDRDPPWPSEYKTYSKAVSINAGVNTSITVTIRVSVSAYACFPGNYTNVPEGTLVKGFAWVYLKSYLIDYRGTRTIVAHGVENGGAFSDSNEDRPFILAGLMLSSNRRSGYYEGVKVYRDPADNKVYEVRFRTYWPEGKYVVLSKKQVNLITTNKEFTLDYYVYREYRANNGEVYYCGDAKITRSIHINVPIFITIKSDSYYEGEFRVDVFAWLKVWYEISNSMEKLRFYAILADSGRSLSVPVVYRWLTVPEWFSGVTPFTTVKEAGYVYVNVPLYVKVSGRVYRFRGYAGGGIVSTYYNETYAKLDVRSTDVVVAVYGDFTTGEIYSTHYVPLLKAISTSSSEKVFKVKQYISPVNHYKIKPGDEYFKWAVAVNWGEYVFRTWVILPDMSVTKGSVENIAAQDWSTWIKASVISIKKYKTYVAVYEYRPGYPYKFECNAVLENGSQINARIVVNGTVYSTPFNVKFAWGQRLNATALDSSDFKFKYWFIRVGDNSFYCYRRTILVNTSTVATAVYGSRTAPPPPGGSPPTTIRLNGSVYYLPYQWIELQGNFTPGIYRIEVKSVFGAPRELIVAVLASPNGSVKYVPADGLVFNLTKHCRVLHLVEEISGECVKPKYIMSCLNYSNYYLVGLGVMNPYDFTQVELLKPWLLDNGTTLAVYNVTLYTKRADRTVYWKLLAITSLNVSIDPVYDLHGVYLVWNVSFSYYVPAWMNISLEKPYQLLECKLLLRNYTVWRQKLGAVPSELKLPESNKYSYTAVYVPYSELVDRFLFDVVEMTARADFKNIIVPFEKGSIVTFKPCGLKLERFTKINATHYYVRVRALAIPGNKEGETLKGGRIKVEYYGKILCDCKINRVYKDLDIFWFIIKRFEPGKGYFKIYYLPKSKKNQVWIVYPFNG